MTIGPIVVAAAVVVVVVGVAAVADAMPFGLERMGREIQEVFRNVPN
jgi:hypothetical protein